MPTTQETSYRRLQKEIVRMFPELLVTDLIEEVKIELAHVLRALGKKNVYLRYDGVLFNWLEFGDENNTHTVKPMGLELPLHLPVSEWPPETLQIILDLITS